MARADDFSSGSHRPRRSDHHRRDYDRRPRSSRIDRRTSSYRTDSGLSPDKLNALNEQLGYGSRSPPRVKRSHRASTRESVYANDEYRPHHPKGGPPRYLPSSRHSRRALSDDFYTRNDNHRRIGSAQPLVYDEKHPAERRRHSRRDYPPPRYNEPHRKRRRKWFIIGGVAAVLLLALIIGLAVGLTTKHNSSNQSNDSKPSNSNLGNISPDSIPPSARGTYLDPYSWYDTMDFNLTFTDQMVGGLPIMGLNSSWDDHVRPNPSVPFLNQPWDYGKSAIRGVNVGGWLSTEPFIKPSLFNTTYSGLADSSVSGPPYNDEWSLSKALGKNQSNTVLEKHYSQFVGFSTFDQIKQAGFDHVRIPFPYWAVATYPGDPYVFRTSWRYLLRGIEYARQCGLRVNLDLHSAPGSQNGWNHSGRQGPIGWLNDTDGALNAQRTLDIHQKLATFFGQPRYANVVTMYGILNEPRMDLLDRNTVLNWTSTAITQLRHSALPNSTVLVISNGFLPIPFWHNALPGYPDPASQRILLDAHQYVIFNADQIALNHTAKLDFACNGWAQQAQQSSDPATGFGSFLCGEWSQADTDCGKWLNGVKTGSRWEGSLDTGFGNTTVRVLQPSCPNAKASSGTSGGSFQQVSGSGSSSSSTSNGGSCSCDQANAPGSAYSATYKKWLRMFADAQIDSFEKGWGWFYWTWEVEDGPGADQLSWRRGIQAGTLPSDVSKGAAKLWNCDTNSEPDWDGEGLPENY